MTTIGLFLNRQNYDFARVEEQLDGFDLIDFSDVTGHEPERLLASCQSIDIALTTVRTPTFPTALAATPGRLKYICHTRGVVHAYFPRALVESGIHLTNWGASPAAGVSSLAFAQLISLIQQIPQKNLSSERRETLTIWQDYPVDLDGFRVGIYGCGVIGRAMADRCHAVGMAVSIFDPWSKHLPEYATTCDSLAELFASNWAVSVHVGLGDTTRDSVNQAMLERLPRGGILINTARGGVVREADLITQVQAGRLMAGLDVCANEGGWPEHPLASEPSALYTGHGRHRPVRPDDVPAPQWQVPTYAIENCKNFVTDQPLVNVIDLETYDRTT